MRFAIATACLFVHACDTVDGGAVELSWKLRPASSSLADKFVDCRTTIKLRDPETGIPFDKAVEISKMRLEWSVTTGENDEPVTGFDEWPCDDSHGVTGFDLPAGTALLSVRPICGPEPLEFDAMAGSYIAPAAEQRRVSLGDTVSLGAVELVVVVSYCPEQSCICE